MGSYVYALTTEQRPLISGGRIGLVKFAYKLASVGYYSRAEADRRNTADETLLRPSQRAWDKRRAAGESFPQFWTIGDKFAEGAEVYAIWEGTDVGITDDAPRQKVGTLRKEGRRWAISPS